jgi:hypothetical protein
MSFFYVIAYNRKYVNLGAMGGCVSTPDYHSTNTNPSHQS